MNPQPPAAPAAPAAPITASEIAALRDALPLLDAPKLKAILIDGHGWDVTNDAGDTKEEYSVLENLTESHAKLFVLAHNLAQKLLAALDVAEQRAAATETELATIHRTLGRGDGHGSLHATADCVISGIVTLKERVAEAEKRADAAEADAAEAKAVEFAWELLEHTGSGERGGRFGDCGHKGAQSAAEYLAERGLLRKSGERAWQRVEGGK